MNQLPKRDTVWHIRHRDTTAELPPIDSCIQDFIYGANGDTTLHVREVPSGLLYTAERSRDVEVWVEKAAYYEPIPGRMLFGEDTARYSAEKQLLPLDGEWMPIIEPPSLKIYPNNTTFDAPMKPTITIHKHEQPIAMFPMDSAVQGIEFALLVVFTAVYIIRSINRWQHLCSTLKTCIFG